jgi:hypothetical protein
MPISVFGTCLNQISTTLASAHASGSGTLVMATGYGARLAAELTAEGLPLISGTAPIRVSVVAPGHGADAPILPGFRTIFRATGLTGDTLTGCTAIEGTTDRAYAIGSAVRFNLTAGAINDIGSAVNALEAAGAASGTVTTVSVVSANGLSGVVANASTTPAITLTIGAGAIANAQLAGSIAASKLVGTDLVVAESQVTGLTADLAAKAVDSAVVHNTGAETIAGVKTFTSTLVASISGNAATATNGVVTTGSYADPAWITSLAGSKVTGDIAGNAAGLTASIAESQVTNLVSDLAAKAPLASPALTGTPTAPTATGGTNTTQLATTAFVQSAVAGGGSVASVFGRSGTVVATTGDYTVSQVTGAAPLASPALTGTPTFAGSTSGTTGLRASAVASGTLTLPAGTDTLATQTYVTGQGYLSSNQSITLSGDVTGSGTTAITTAIGSGKVTNAMLAGSIAASKLVGSDIVVAESQVTSLTTDLAGKQPLDATLTALAGVTTAADKLIYAMASDTFATTTLTTFGRSLVDDADAAAARTTLGLVIGTDVLAPTGDGSGLTGLVQSQVSGLVSALAGKQPLDATLTALAGVTTAADKLVYATGADAFATADLTAYARTLIDDADAATARTTLGLGTAATQSSGTFLQAANNLSDVTAATARTNLGLGTIATQSASAVAITGGTLTGVAVASHGGSRATSSSGAFDLAASDWYVRTLDGTNGTLSLSNELSRQTFFVELVQDGTGSRGVTWFAAITWMTTGGTAPQPSTTAGKTTLYSFKQTAAGAYLGFLVGTNQ